MSTAQLKEVVAQHLESYEELARYIEHTSCAIDVLGDLLKAIPEEKFNCLDAQSLGFLLKILGDGMLQCSLNGYDYLQRNHKAAPSMEGQAPPPA